MKSSNQYSASFAITDAIKGSSTEKVIVNWALNLYSNNYSAGNFVSFFKILKNQSFKYLFEFLPTTRQAYTTRDKNGITHFNGKLF